MIDSQATDSNFSGGPDIGPDQKGKHFTTFPEIDLRPQNLRMQSMKLEFLSKWFAPLRDLSRFINPKRGFYEGFVPNWNAQIDYKLIMSSDPQAYADTLAAGMMSGLSSRSQPWFKLGLGIPQLEENEDVKLWLSIVEKVLYKIFDDSNHYDAFQSAYKELGIFSTCAFGIYEDSLNVARCRSFTIGEYFLANDHTGRVNSFARSEWKTVDQIVNEFGWNNCSSLVQNAYKKGQRDIYMMVYYLTEPNDNMIPGRENYEGKPWRSTYWEAKSVSQKALKLSGFHEFPIMAAKWDVVTTADTYGIDGPGWVARGDIKSLYRVLKDLYLAVAKVADPPVQLGSGVEGTASLIPGGMTRNSKDNPDCGVKAAYQVNPDIDHTMQLVQYLSQKISSRFYADLFTQMVQSDSKEMTAREVVEKQKDKLLLLGPVVSRVQKDLLGPAIQRTFMIAMRAGALPPPPQSIWGMPIAIRYIGLLAQAQQMARTAAIEQGVKFVGDVVGVFPEAKDLVDIDKAVTEYCDSLGADIVRSPEKVAQIRAQMQKAMQAQQQQAAMAQLAQTGKTMSDTTVGGGASLLDHVLGTQGQVGQQ